MSRKSSFLLAASAALLLLDAGATVQAQNNMTFFVTSIGAGDGANLGGLTGADQHCFKLAQSVGAGQRTWRAYLSTTGVGSATCINARDRIGQGPWQNAKGQTIATDVDNLHGDNNLTKQTALTEKGGVVNGRGDNPNMHDILTGSTPDGRCFPVSEGDTTCGNWTKDGEGSAQLGHSDRTGLDESAPAKSWNSSHRSRGCSQANLVTTGGAGLLYCFAIN